MAIKSLWVIMPVYNEEVSLPTVLNEWILELEKSCIPYKFCLINDGSTDSTLKLLRQYEVKYPQLKVVDKTNTGHGQTCIYGYKIAIENGADWIFQIDSDGQCSPEYFLLFLKNPDKYPISLGYRKTRQDGINRWLISRMVSVFTFITTRYWIKDLNVPYRLMKADLVRPLLPLIPNDFHLANIYLTVLLQKYYGIHWINIQFLKRIGGLASKSSFSFIRHGFILFSQLRNAVRSQEPYKAI